ncbi:neuronal acetylcholine receptor subunit non-alpha-2-like [Ylistrum balloti]|uniref:neuronal acetylcholine receptor subunit non-alpha-2-like n=1 Tax=Ylistrum balloti TaxID=509963 RepID=UPI0029058CFF|nr:neuronal acetylcholine receptor subunit non-alpha-2-like [Ylistrum balloti]
MEPVNKMLLWCFLSSMTSLTHSHHITTTLDEQKKLLTRIFDGYDKRLRPVLKQSYSVHVNMTFALNSINEFDEKSQKLAVTGVFDLRWTDESLLWNKSEYGNAFHVHIDGNSIWLPNIALMNTFGKITMLTHSAGTALVYFDGTVMWFPGDSYVVTCEVDITYYPFDSQDCYFRFKIWDGPVSEVALISNLDTMNLIDFQENVEWALIKTEAKSSGLDYSSMQSYVDYMIRLKRRPKFVVLTMLTPVILLAFLNICVFLIPLSSGEKNSFCVTVYLSYAVFMGLIASELPHNSQHVSYLTMYLLALLVFSVVIVLITVIQVRLFIEYGETPAPASISNMLGFKNTSQVNPLGSNDVVDFEDDVLENKEVNQSKRNQTRVCLKDVLPKLDCPLFCCFLVVFIIMTIVIGVVTYSHSL